MKNKRASVLAMILACCGALLIASPRIARADSGPEPEPGMCVATTDLDPPAPVVQPDPDESQEEPR